MTKDERMLIRIKNPKLQKVIRCVIEEEGLTHEEFIAKYLKLPEDKYEPIQIAYNDMKNMAMNVTESDKQHFKGMMDIIWTVIILVIKGKLSAKKVWESVGEDLMNERYKV